MKGKVSVMLLTERYQTLKSIVENSSRGEEFRKLMYWLENNTEYLTAPASTKYHLSKESGLLEHSCNVAETLIRLKKSMTMGTEDVSMESCIIVGLLHDVGKVGSPDNPLYVKNEPTEKQKKYGYPANPPYRWNNDLIHMNHAVRSLYTVSEHMRLTEEEAQAIIYHDGQYIPDNISVQHRECKLAVLLHWADYWSCRFLEVGNDFKL